MHPSGATKNVNNASFHYLALSNELDQKYNEDPQEKYPEGTMKISGEATFSLITRPV